MLSTKTKKKAPLRVYRQKPRKVSKADRAPVRVLPAFRLEASSLCLFGAIVLAVICSAPGQALMILPTAMFLGAALLFKKLEKEG